MTDPARTLEHVTIQTGHVRASPRAEVSDDLISEIRTAMQLHGGRLWDTGWSVKIDTQMAGGWIVSLAHRGVPVIRMAVCSDLSVSNKLWSEIAPVGSRAKQPTTVPWCAANLLRMAQPTVMLQAGDLERCVAWALLA